MASGGGAGAGHHVRRKSAAVPTGLALDATQMHPLLVGDAGVSAAPNLIQFRSALAEKRVAVALAVLQDAELRVALGE